MMTPMTSTCGSAVALTAAIVLAAFVSEDGATITAASLAASAALDAKLAFFGAVAGLWVGDLGVYGLARRIGPAILQYRWFSVRPALANLPSEGVGASTAQLRLGLSRFLPGTRLPAYISAGLRRMPFGTFAGITAFSALAWVLLIFIAIHLVPARGAAAKQQLGLLGLFDLAVFAILATWRQWNKQIVGALRRLPIAYERCIRWEFWPAWIFYSPVALICAWLGLKYKGFSLPTIANLNQKNGGIVGESKIGVLQTLMETSPQFTAESFLIRAGSPSERCSFIEELFWRHNVGFPFVLKPDSAQRGAGFKIIRSFEDAAKYLAQVSAPVVMQKYVRGPNEAGIFYYRFPREPQGHIFAITRKRFPVVTGDGFRTLKQLIENDSRARLIAKTYLRRFPNAANFTPLRNEVVRLAEAGNHCQGAIFEDGSDLFSPQLLAAFEEISQKLRGFYIGRYDIRYSSDDDLRSGTNFQIIELNGAASEATNIYDAGNSLLSAYRTLFQQWKLVYEIGAINRRRGHRPIRPLTVYRDWLSFSRQAMQFPIAD